MNHVLTHGYFLSEDPVEQKILKPYPPLGILSISAYLEENQLQHQVIDTTFLTPEEWKEKIETLRPKIIGFYTNLMTKVKILELIKWIKNHKNLSQTKVILGGPDVTYNCENYLNHGADYLVIGEGEETYFELTQAIENQNDLTQIDGIAFKKGEKICKTTSRTKIKDINSLPTPNRKKINLTPYLQTWKTKHGKRTLNISTQRGCPYTCKWCSTAVYGQSYRRRDPKLVVDEIENLIEQYQIEALWFVDDVFTVSHKWIDAFTEQMKSRNIQIEFECITRAERLNEDILKKLKSIGCFRIWIGAESGSQRIIDLMDRRVDIHKVQDMIQLTQSHDIEAGTFIMLGYPTEQKEDIDKTIEYLKKASPSQFTITVAYPIKGTELYKQIKDSITHKPPWPISTDRQIDFKRTYPRKYYEHAVRKVVNEVNFHKEKIKGQVFTKKAIAYKLKATISTLKMKRYKPE